MLSIPSPVAQFQTLPTQNCPNSPEHNKIRYVNLYQRSNTFQLEKRNNPIIRPITSPSYSYQQQFITVFLPPQNNQQLTVSPLSAILQAERKWSTWQQEFLTNPREQETNEP